ncbi:BadF/BadG/BcrA/BcrD ATPase family protein, partial [Tetragenococcus halophilus]
DKEDIAASIFQAVVNQTIAGLASGRKIRGKIAFLGGPLYFMSELRQRFIETLQIAKEDVIFPQDSQLYVAMGAALYSESNDLKTIDQLLDCLLNGNGQQLIPTDTLAPLFASEKELNDFQNRHQKATVKKSSLNEFSGSAFLGIDAGSTTTKIVLIDGKGSILYSFYGNNEGEPLQKTIDVLTKLYQNMPADVFIAKACVTGYGEKLIKNALKIDIGEVETMAHYKAADFFYPGVDFI